MNYLNSETYLNPNTSTIATVDELRYIAAQYIDPIEHNSFSNVLEESNV